MKSFRRTSHYSCSSYIRVTFIALVAASIKRKLLHWRRTAVAFEYRSSVTDAALKYDRRRCTLRDDTTLYAHRECVYHGASASTMHYCTSTMHRYCFCIVSMLGLCAFYSTHCVYVLRTATATQSDVHESPRVLTY